MNRVLIAGCGFVGEKLASLLVARNARVFGLKRNVAGLPTGVEPVVADLTDPNTLRHLPGDLDAVVFCAAPGKGTPETYRAVYVDGIRNLCQALPRAAAIPRMLFVSSTAVYAQTDGSWVSEGSSAEPVHYTGTLMLEAERTLASLAKSAIILRCGGIYGRAHSRLVESVRSGTATVHSGTIKYTNRIHRDDVALAILHLLGLDAPLPLYLGVDSSPAPQQEVLQWLAQRLGVPAPLENPTAPSEGSMSSNKRCSNQRLLDSGYRFLYPSYREGYGAELPKLAEAAP